MFHQICTLKHQEFVLIHIQIKTVDKTFERKMSDAIRRTDSCLLKKHARRNLIVQSPLQPGARYSLKEDDAISTFCWSTLYKHNSREIVTIVVLKVVLKNGSPV